MINYTHIRLIGYFSSISVSVFLLSLSLFFTPTLGKAQPKKTAELKVISHNSRFKTYYTNGAIDNFGDTRNIAFFKGYILYEIPTTHLESKVTHINFDEIKDGDTIFSDDDGPSIIKEITYEYFVVKQDQKSGLWFKDTSSPGTSYLLDSLLKSTNLDSANIKFNSIDFGTPTEIVKTKDGRIILEKFYTFKKDSDSPDTVFRYYDYKLKDINFSLSPSLDKAKQSKLYRSILTKKYAHSLTQGTNLEPYKLEIIDEFNLVTDKCTKRQLEIFEMLFNRFIAQTEK